MEWGFHKTPKELGLGSFLVGEHMEVLEESSEPGQGVEVLTPFPYLTLCISSIWLFLSYNLS